MLPRTFWPSATFAERPVGPPSIGSRTVRKPGGIPSTTGGATKPPGGAPAVAGLAAAAENGGGDDFVRDVKKVAPHVVNELDATVSIVSRNDGCAGTKWDAFVKADTMFVRVPKEECWSRDEKLGFKECIVAVLELAETVLGTENLVVCLEKSRNDLAHLMRAFMFVGFEMVHPAVYGFGDGYVLLGCSV